MCMYIHEQSGGVCVWAQVYTHMCMYTGVKYMHISPFKYIYICSRTVYVYMYTVIKCVCEGTSVYTCLCMW